MKRLASQFCPVYLKSTLEYTVYSPRDDFTEEVDVTKALQYLKLKSSSGADGFSNPPLKYAACALSAVSTYFALVKRSIEPASHVCGLSFSYLINLVCECHMKASSDFAVRIPANH